VKEARLLLLGKLDARRDPGEQRFVECILGLAEEETRDEIIWKFNDKSLEQELLEKLRKKCEGQFLVPYFPGEEFHIADIMTLEVCREGWLLREAGRLQDLIAYTSIGCFTMATERYYMGDYTRKQDHLKALKLALAAFDLRCTYVTFLLKILKDHFG
jgi:hypothetical protein